MKFSKTPTEGSRALCCRNDTARKKASSPLPSSCNGICTARVWCRKVHTGFGQTRGAPCRQLAEDRFSFCSDSLNSPCTWEHLGRWPTSSANAKDLVSSTSQVLGQKCTPLWRLRLSRGLLRPFPQHPRADRQRGAHQLVLTLWALLSHRDSCYNSHCGGTCMQYEQRSLTGYRQNHAGGLGWAAGSGRRGSGSDQTESAFCPAQCGKLRSHCRNCACFPEFLLPVTVSL
ncbi:uncharacterized protein LOC128571728 [Nycticebus coucang]|uniref:uncharacterized protein LOC128571728 n=1 Tax=Nycticebus coucang TaxID=9470 RepID=UPI00234CD1DB|nr:uncharacterized protein LOC128571728 [Nycticebus coucang]